MLPGTFFLKEHQELLGVLEEEEPQYHLEVEHPNSLSAGEPDTFVTSINIDIKYISEAKTCIPIVPFDPVRLNQDSPANYQ